MIRSMVATEAVVADTSVTMFDILYYDTKYNFELIDKKDNSTNSYYRR